jgi:ABC-type antimicrobial peptide transport system permease subunit
VTQRRPLIVISEALAKEHWKDASSAIGQRVRSLFPPEAPWREIVGVVGNERDDGLNQPPTAIVYWPILNESYRWRIMGIAASVALLIGVVGIYGVIAYAAAQRTREIGVRMVLGAQRGDVRKMFLRQGLLLTAVGIALGVGVAVALTRVMSSFLFGVGPLDPVTYAVVSGTLAAAALLATYLPARRASQVDPIVALRADLEEERAGRRGNLRARS